MKADKDFLTDDDIATLKANPIDLVVCAHATTEVRAHSLKANRDATGAIGRGYRGLRHVPAFRGLQPEAFEACEASSDPFVAK